MPGQVAHKNSIIYFSIGNNYFYHQTVFSAWSLIVQTTIPLRFDLLIFTDQPDTIGAYFPQIDHVRCIPLSAADIAEMQGAIGFIHRVKIACIQKAFDIGYEKVLYLDSDTIVLQPISDLFALITTGHSLMHVEEFAFDSALLDNFAPTFDFKNYIISHEIIDPISQYRITPSFKSFNAGVIGVHHHDSHLLKTVFELTDYLYPPTQHHATEQFMFSYVLSKYSKLRYSNTHVYHYWYPVKKNIADLYFAQLFTSHFLAISHEEKTKMVYEYMQQLDTAFKDHKLIVQDRTYQYLYAQETRQGIMHALKTVIRGKGNISYLKNVVYLLVKLNKQ